jgi:2-dehydro-3-deoxyphosphogluconate aldolase/(4S)-4-hydroxy-2-oxoglutarate aldolase
MEKNQALEKIKKLRVMPLFYHGDPETATRVMKAVFDGGIDLLEFTNRGENAYSVFEELVDYKQAHHPTAALGIGSIVDPDTATKYIEAGADFLVTPLLNKEVVNVCLEREILCIPGCSTLTEIYRAETLGAELVKVFPAAQLGGPAYIKAIKGPCPWLSIVVTGGVKATAADLKAWHDAGVTGFGLGSDLIPKDLVKNGDYDGLTLKIKELAGIVASL